LLHVGWLQHISYILSKKSDQDLSQKFTDSEQLKYAYANFFSIVTAPRQETDWNSIIERKAAAVESLT
jgi:hypothetical protein